MTRRVAAKPGFTLIELLVVIAIIVLLIGILVPALNAARDQAKKASSAARIKALGTGAEMFHKELDKYPRSSGTNPFLGGTSDFLSGAQWLLVQLSGPDLRGYVKPTKSNDTNGDGKIDEVDWNAWYALGADYSRVGPFMPPEGDNSISAERYTSLNPSADPPPALLNQTANNWDGGKIPFYLDGFNYPILYYKAGQSKQPFTTGSGAGNFGRYNQLDNGVFTGSDVDGPVNYGSGWDLIGQGKLHGMGKLGWSSSNPNRDPADPSLNPPTFASVVYDRNIYETTRVNNQGRVWPHKPDGFILVSPGRDGLYGTQDDVRNY